MIQVTETPYGLSLFIPGERASADLSWIDPEGLFYYNLPPGKWLFFNRLINFSGKPGLGTQLIDELLSICRKKGYSILNQVSAYGRLNQKQLEKWYISKGFIPVDYGKYGNKLLKWEPK